MHTTLSNGQAGIRSSLQIEIHGPSLDTNESIGSNSGGGSVLDFIASDESLDRYGEVISASGWRLDSYRRNPVFQNAHQYGDILFTIGRAVITEVRQVAGRAALYQRVQFATEVNPIARIAFGLYRGKFLNAVSVGFIPLRWQDGNKNGQGPPSPVKPSSAPPARAFRRKYLEQELLEVSAVGIPANPNALALAVKSGAVDKTDLRETLELLRNVCAIGSTPELGRQTAQRDHLLLLARELRRILRRA
jgi:hypothetical protein